jgi:hypothetical protein
MAFKKLNLSHSHIFSPRDELTVRRVAKNALSVIFAGPGKTPTDDLRKLSTLTKQLDETLSKDSKNQSLKIRKAVAMATVFTKVAKEMNVCKTCMDELPVHLDNSLSLIHSINKVIKNRDFIEFDTSSEVRWLAHPSNTASQWIVLDLIDYCWNDGQLKNPDALATLLGQGFQSGGQNGFVIEAFEHEVVVEMFKAISEISESFGNPEKYMRYPTQVYRGGYGKSASEIAGGMRWSTDIEVAMSWRNVDKRPSGEFVLVEAIVNRADVLASFEYEDNVILLPDNSREFQQVDLRAVAQLIQEANV